MKDSEDALQRELQLTVPATAEIYQKTTDKRLLNGVKNADQQPQEECVSGAVGSASNWSAVKSDKKQGK